MLLFQDEAFYVGIWQKPALNKVPYEAHYGRRLWKINPHLTLANEILKKI